MTHPADGNGHEHKRSLPIASPGSGRRTEQPLVTINNLDATITGPKAAGFAFTRVSELWAAVS